MTTLPEWRILAPLAVSRVSRTWQVVLAAGEVAGEVAGEGEQLAVFRQDEPGARHLQLNRVAEPDVLRVAAAAGLGPACLAADPARGLLLTAWLPGRAWSAAELREPAQLERAAALLGRLHRTPLAAPVVDLAAVIERYAGLAGPSVAGLASRARAELSACLAADPARPCFCHNDPTPGNFVAGPDGQLRLIDWEYAGVCHPGFDLAGLATGVATGPDLTPGELVRLHTAYRGRAPTVAELARHRAWEVLCRSVGALWAAALGTSPGHQDHAGSSA